jgi:thiamine pyrophosphate-dependent acetolactate synthase large subunit-like protein
MGAGDPDAIRHAADALAAAQRPFVHAGKGVLWARGADDLLALCDHLQAGMSATLGARGVVPEDHPRYFHPFDLAGVGTARREADVVLVVGARLGEYDGWGVPPTWGDPATQTTIQIDADPLSIRCRSASTDRWTSRWWRMHAARSRHVSPGSASGASPAPR